MRRSAGLAMVMVSLVVATAACTGGGASRPEAPSPWALDGLAAAPVDAALQGSIDAPPAEGRAKVLGVARLSGTDVVLSLRNGTCQAAFLPADLTSPAAMAPASIGAQRPDAGADFSGSHARYPGTVLAGRYTRATGTMGPFAFADLGCSENGLALRLEGVGESEPVRKVAGDSLAYWRSGRDVLLTVGNVAPTPADGVVVVR